MANLRDTITLALNLDKNGFTSGLRSMASDVRNADGIFGKLKAGVNGLGSSFKAAASNPAVMATAVSAAGAAMIKVAGDASELGVEIGKLADATGLSAEGASRLAEVAGDIGISTGTLTSSIGRMNKTIATSPDLFKSLGIEIARTEDGAADIDQTFLNAVDAINGIKNPTDKAAAASKVFGKGWQEMAELIGQGADTIKTNMAGVGDAKVFDDKAVQEARDYRAAMDQLGDDFGEIALQVGRGLVPVLKEAAGFVDKIFKLGDKLPDIHIANPFDDFNKDDPLDFFAIKQDVQGNLEGVGEAATDATGAVEDLGEAIEAVPSAPIDDQWERLKDDYDKIVAAWESMLEMSDRGSDSIVPGEWETAAAKLAGTFQQADTTYQTLMGHLDEREAWRNAQDAIEKLWEVLADPEHSAADAEEALDGVKRQYAEILHNMDAVPPEVKTALELAIDGADLEHLGQVQTAIEYLKDHPNTPVAVAVAIAAGDMAKAERLVKLLEKIQTAGKGGGGGIGARLPDTGAGQGFGGQSANRGQSSGGRGMSSDLGGGYGAGGSSGGIVWENGEWVEQAEEAADAAEKSVEEQNRAEDDLMRRRKERGEISEQELLDYLERRRAAEDAAGRHNGDYEYALWQEITGIRDEAAQREKELADAAADAVKDAEEKKRDAYAKTAEAYKAALEKIFAAAEAGKDLAEAVEEQKQAIAELLYVQAAAANGDEDAIAKLAGYTKNAAKETFEGAQAQAAAQGLKPGTPEYAAFIQGEISRYLAEHPELGGAFAAALQQQVSGLPTSSALATLPPVNVTLMLDGQVLANVLTQPITTNQQRRLAGNT